LHRQTDRHVSQSDGRLVESAKKHLPFLILGALSTVGIRVASAQADDGYVGIYSDSLGSTPCTEVEQYTSTTLYVIAKTAGGSANGIRGAEFRIEVTNPSGWILSFTPPGAANVVLGNPVDADPDPDAGGGLNLGFPSCQAPDGSGRIRLGTLSVFNLNGSPTELRVKRHSQPSNAGYACPLFVKCGFSLLCMTPASEDSCTVGAEKGVVGADGDLSCFVAAVFESTTMRSVQLATALADHDVQSISRAFPDFNLADTLGTTRTGETVQLMNYSRIYRLSLPPMGNAEELRTALRSVREVLFVHYDGGAIVDGVCTFDSIPECETTVTTCPDDSLFEQQWSLVNWGQNAAACDADIDVDGAWEFTTGSVNVRIGILDTGVWAANEDVAGKVTGDLIPGIAGGIWHGTAVACIAAANTNNMKGIAGVDHNARLVSLTHGPDSTIVRKVRWAATNGLHVLNCSFALGNSQGFYFSHCVRAAFRDYYMCNGVAVASMGNSGEQGSPIQYPAAFGQGVIAVAATDSVDQVVETSSRGNHVDVAAPGLDVMTCVPANPIPNRYIKEDGTSMAAPHVAGLAGLLFSYDQVFSGSDLSNDDIEQIIRLSANDLEPAGFDSLSGMGRINARAAFELIRSPNRLYSDQQALGGTLQTSDWQGEICFLFPPPGLEDGWYTAFRHAVETVVAFPVAFASPPHVWGRGFATIGYSTDGSDAGFDNVNYGMGWCEPVGTITASSCTLRTYVYSLRDSTGAHIAWAPTDAANVKYAYSVLGELQTTDAEGFPVVEAAGERPTITSMNPIGSDGRLRVWLPNTTWMPLEIYDVSGRLVRLLHHGQITVGTHEFIWDGTTASGCQAASGLYFARLEASDRVVSHKLVVLR
jgi:subtilisin family serine protease